MFKRVLVANRGEIAIRIMRTLREMGIESVAVFSKVDRTSLHTRYADFAIEIGEPEPSKSYLDIDRIIWAAKKSKAEAIHPGYGFLSENPEFVRAVTEAGLVFIGPSPEVIELMGKKIESRMVAESAGLCVVPGTKRPIMDLKEALKKANEIGYPILLKASMGGGGKGMRIVEDHRQLKDALERAMSEAKKAFGNDAIYIEKFIKDPHHIEIQILGDQRGNVIHLFERECSIQRRYQKIVEETPSPFINDDTRQKICQAAVDLAKKVGYVGAGTVEFIVDSEQNFYFLEMNTRLQVEHPITEMTTGIDIVKEQLRIGAGQSISYTQSEIKRWGHAVETRIYAEDPKSGFLPSAGKINYYREPTGIFVRVDSGVASGSICPVEYDPIIAKMSCWGRDRKEALIRAKRCLGEFVIKGIKTNVSFLKRVVEHKDFIEGNYNTRFVEDRFQELITEDEGRYLIPAVIAACIFELETMNNREVATGPDANRDVLSNWRWRRR